MGVENFGMYIATMILVGFFGAFLTETVDRKSDVMAGFREAPIRKKKVRKSFFE